MSYCHRRVLCIVGLAIYWCLLGNVSSTVQRTSGENALGSQTVCSTDAHCTRTIDNIEQSCSSPPIFPGSLDFTLTSPAYFAPSFSFPLDMGMYQGSVVGALLSYINLYSLPRDLI